MLPLSFMQSVVFQSIKPSLLDLPASFYWTPEKYSHCSEETKKPVCFRYIYNTHIMFVLINYEFCICMTAWRHLLVTNNYTLCMYTHCWHHHPLSTIRATVQHHGDPHCQTTEICVQLTNDTIKCPEIPSVAPTSTVTSNYTSVTPSVTPTPSQDRVNQVH